MAIVVLVRREYTHSPVSRVSNTPNTNLAQCYTSSPSDLPYAVNPAIPINSEDVQKVLIAKCELNTVTGFANAIWPTYGTHPQWRNGDYIYYARPDLLGQLGTVTKNTLVLLHPGDTTIPEQTYTTPLHQSIAAYYYGKPIALSDLHPGDTIFSIVRVREVYSSDGPASNGGSPVVQGIVGLVKLAYPLQYYQGMQNDVIALNPCIGNPGEQCPQPLNQFNIFPSDNNNMNSQQPTTPRNSTTREIAGSITQLTDNTIIIRGSAGDIYTIILPSGIIASYNARIAPNESPHVTVQTGSSIDVMYVQPSGSDPHTITAQQIDTLSLNVFTPTKD
ncbi:MAG TPA: hypothetical protein VMB52_00265 [Verrucomicrobiae bacterium]|nr:hypothetical protein [Verrucomicrobiae bacterium]